MATSKTTASKKTKPKPTTTKPLGELDAQDPSYADALLARLFAQHPPLDEAHRAAFGALLTDAQADDLGKRTRGVDVRAEGLRWAIQMDDSIRAYPGALDGYSPVRFVHYLECVGGLHKALSAEEKKRRKLGSARGDADFVRDGAMVKRNALVSVLRTCAGRRAQEREALATAVGTTDTPENLGASLTALAKLGKSWLERSDEISKILAQTAGLTSDKVVAAVEAAKSLQAAATGASMEGRSRPTDTPPINRAEGRLLFEMLEARRLFNEANERSGVVQKLSPGPSVRHVFVRKAVAGGGEEEIGDGGAPAGAENAPPKG